MPRKKPAQRAVPLEELNRKLETLIFGALTRRYTQDSPVMPDVWATYFQHPDEAQDLLLTPHSKHTPGALAGALREALRRGDSDPPFVLGLGKNARDRYRQRFPLVYNESYVAVSLWFDEMVRLALPLTNWWQNYMWKRNRDAQARQIVLRPGDRELASELAGEFARDLSPRPNKHTEDFLWLLRLLGEFVWMNLSEQLEQFRHESPKSKRGVREGEPGTIDLVDGALFFLSGLVVGKPAAEKQVRPEGEPAPEAKPIAPVFTPLWSINLNREARVAIWRSTDAVKALAARRVFAPSCRRLIWAVLDSGVDATHPAFRRRDAAGVPSTDIYESRVAKTYDFTRIRARMAPPTTEEGEISFSVEDRERIKAMKRATRAGLSMDWDSIGPLLEVPHKKGLYHVPEHPHGTHVAGIIAADWRKSDPQPPEDHEELTGMCPDIELYDLRVLDKDGRGSEFGIIAALQFVRYLNSIRDKQLIHGINLSLAIPHKVANFACGRTPICEECERLMNNGVIVVAAAGNVGYTGGPLSMGSGYQDISITDPGNGDAIITVGSTHRHMPHTYGVSYFSSRGPTADGRSKPDLVAPGEKIKSPIPQGRAATLDGTSMAAPHVSGAAALLLAQFSELVGQSGRVKQILCRSATDLGRERHFQGAGMLDVLRAMQSV